MASESSFFVHLSALSDEYERMRQENQSLKQELGRESSTQLPQTNPSWSEKPERTEKEATSGEEMVKTCFFFGRVWFVLAWMKKIGGGVGVCQVFFNQRIC